MLSKKISSIIKLYVICMFTLSLSIVKIDYCFFHLPKLHSVFFIISTMHRQIKAQRNFATKENKKSMGISEFASVVSARKAYVYPFRILRGSRPRHLTPWNPRIRNHTGIPICGSFCRNLRILHVCTPLGSYFFLARSGTRHCETAGSRWHTCKDARVDACVLKTHWDDRIYKARSTRNGISPRYVATYAFRKWFSVSSPWRW